MTSLKPQLICFSESSNANIISTTINLNKEAAPIIHLDTFDAGPEHKILALHEDGTVIAYSIGLKTEEWYSSITAGASNMDAVPAIQAAATLSVQQARKTILKSREDILATLGPDVDAVDRSLLLVMTRAPTREASSISGTLELRVICIKLAYTNKSGLVISKGQNLQHLMTLAMPEPSLFTSKKTHISMHTASGTVFQSVEGSLAVYDLTGSVPRIAYTAFQDNASSYLRLSPELVAYSRGASFSVMDFQYGSLQVEGTLTLSSEVSGTQETKRRKDKLPTAENARLLSYFAPLDVMVALDGRKLISVQLCTTQKVGESRKRKRKGLLVNSIGRGSSIANSPAPSSVRSTRKIKSLGAYLLPSSDFDDWKDQKAILDRCLAQDDEKEFERFMNAALYTKAFEENKRISSSGGRNHVNQHALSYILSAIFAVDQASLHVDPVEDNTNLLVIRSFPHQIGNWLINKGFLTLSQIEMSLKHYGALPVTSKLASESLIRALQKLDPSLEILLSLLTSPIPLSSQELTHVLVIITQSQNTEATEIQRLLTNDNRGDNSGKIEELQLVNGQPPDPPLSPSQILPSNNLTRRLLRLAMRRLYACPSSSVAQALKKVLSTEQLRSIVDTLRMEIARSGWLCPYEDSVESLDLDFQENGEMCFIAHLFNCVIDSLGTGGWIRGNSTSYDLTETADTIAYMKAEISAALEGIAEATYLKGMLGEILLCGKDCLNSSAKQSRSNQAQPSDLPQKPMTIALNEEDSQLLPLGLKPASVFSTTKVGAGGELIRRSRRDIGRLKSRMVGKYSFDRIKI